MSPVRSVTHVSSRSQRRQSDCGVRGMGIERITLGHPQQTFYSSRSGIICRSMLLSPTLSARVEATVPMLQLWPRVPAMPNRLPLENFDSPSPRNGSCLRSMELMGRSVTLMKTIWHVYGSARRRKDFR